MKKILNAYTTPLLFLTVSLSLFGIIVSGSLSIVYPNLILRQIVSVILGYALMIFFAFFNHRKLASFAKIAYIVLVLSLVYLLFSKGNSRFISIGLFSIQPSQFAYIVISLLIARIFRDKIDEEQIPKVYAIIFALIVLVSALIAFEPDMGSAAQFFLTGFSLLSIIGMPLFEFFSFSLLSLFGVIAMIPLNKEWHRRVVAFLNPYAHASDEALQTLQSLRAFARGGITGVGFMKGIFKYPSVLPVSISDFILPVIGEEFGAVFVILLILTYLGIIYLGFKISYDARSIFSRILALGLTLGIAWFAVINIAVNLGLMPTTGVPLPFISYGANNMLANFIAIGILINISRTEVE
jgi:cell division protein FtsW (lipid II flippase)